MPSGRFTHGDGPVSSPETRKLAGVEWRIVKGDDGLKALHYARCCASELYWAVPRARRRSWNRGAPVRLYRRYPPYRVDLVPPYRVDQVLPYDPLQV